MRIEKTKTLGFTLIELLVVSAIVGIISVVGVNLLFSTVIAKARQNSIATGSDDVRNFMNQVSTSLKQAKSFSTVSPFDKIEITQERTKDDGTTEQVCKTFRLYAGAIELAQVSGVTCTPPSSGFTKLTDTNTVVSSLLFSQSDNAVIIYLSVNHKDSFGSSEIKNYKTTVVSRI